MNVDFIVVGSGLAGLTSALTLADYGDVLLVSKESLVSGSSSLAQGGIATVFEKTDSFANHVHDTMVAGAWHSNEIAVRFLVEHGPAAVAWLEKQGVLFDRDNNDFALGKEAAHSHRRILHI